MERTWFSDKRLLLVEDDFLLAECMREALQDQGAIVIGPAASLQRGIDLLDTEEGVQAAILDVNVRGEAIFPLADLLVERNLPFVFVSGYDRELIPSRFDKIKHCIKPVDVATVCTAFESI
jgi:DNA-binding response OmpR family regulator